MFISKRYHFLIFVPLLVLISSYVPSKLFAETCEDNPEYCTPAKLCEKSTETFDNVLYWISDENNRFLKTARKFGLDCRAKPALSNCERSADLCSIADLCKIATIETVNEKVWNKSMPGHVDLAKQFGLRCDVNTSAVQRSSSGGSGYSKCVKKASVCNDRDLCNVATYDKRWRVDSYESHVKEAKRRSLNCGVAETVQKSSKTNYTNTSYERCDANLSGCSDIDLCKSASYKSFGKMKWKTVASYGKFIDEAKRRGLSCGVVETVKGKTAYARCNISIKTCSDADLCETATWGGSKKQWKVGSYSFFVKEAKSRGLSCGVVETVKGKTAYARCNMSIKTCSDIDLCETATWGGSKKQWKVGSYTVFVNEAKRRNLACGVNEAKSSALNSSSATSNLFEAIEENEKKAKVSQISCYPGSKPKPFLVNPKINSDVIQEEVGTSWTFVHHRTHEINGSTFFEGHLISSRGGHQPDVGFVNPNEWVCSGPGMQKVSIKPKSDRITSENTTIPIGRPQKLSVYPPQFDGMKLATSTNNCNRGLFHYEFIDGDIKYLGVAKLSEVCSQGLYFEQHSSREKIYYTCNMDKSMWGKSDMVKLGDRWIEKNTGSGGSYTKSYFECE